MTESEQISVYGRLFLEAKQTEEELACRRDQVYSFANRLRRIAEILDRNAAAQPSGEDCLAGPPPAQQLPQHEYGNAYEYEKAISLLTELRNARLKVYDVHQRESLLRGRHGNNTH
jgi:hypothetical protein